MNKLPVFQTLGRAIGFVFGNLFTIARLSWFPMLLLFALAFVVPIYVIRGELAWLGQPVALGPQWAWLTEFGTSIIPWAVMFGFIQLAVGATIAVALHRIILFKDRNPGTVFLASFGRAEFIYTLMILFTAIVVDAVVFAAMYAATLVDPNVASLTNIFVQLGGRANVTPEMGHALIVLAVAMIIGVFVVLWFCARVFVFPAAVVATNKFALSETLQLTHGNVWRIISLFVLTILMAIVIAMAFVKFFPNLLIPDPSKRAGLLEPYEAWWLYYENWGQAARIVLLSMAVSILVAAFGVGMMSHAYKALKGIEPGDAIGESKGGQNT